MCLPCDAARERREAAQGLRVICEAKFGLAPALRQVFHPVPTNDEFANLLKKLDRA